MNFLTLKPSSSSSPGTYRIINLDHIVEIIIPEVNTGGSIKDIHGKMHILHPDQVAQLLSKLDIAIELQQPNLDSIRSVNLEKKVS